MNSTRLGTRDLRARSLFIAILATSMGACVGSPNAPQADGFQPIEVGEELPVIQIVEGSFDGEELTFRTLQPDELIARGLMHDDTAPRGHDGVGVAVEPLVPITSHGCTPSTCTGVDYVAFSNVAGGSRAITNGAAVTNVPAVTTWGASDLATCGTAPTTGVCQQIRMRSLFGAQQLERVYAQITEIRPTGTATTAASVRASPYTAVPDFGIDAIVPNGLFRAGEIGRGSPATGGVTMWWAFQGTATGTLRMTYSFLVQVHGLVVSPTQRATLVDGALDAPASDYPTQTVITPASANISISEDGRFVAFATTTTVFRKDLTSGALTTIATGCTSASNPHLSRDGNVVVFQAAGCDLAGVGSTTATPQIYAWEAGTTTLVSSSTTAGYANGTSQLPRVSADGAVVVYQSTATNLVSGTPTTGRTACVEVYRFDRAASTTQHASATRFSSISTPGAGWIDGCNASQPAGINPDVSGDGNLVVFSGTRALQGVSDSNNRSDIYIYDHASSVSSDVAVVYRVSLTNTGAQLTMGSTAGAVAPTISSDGAFVAFATDAPNVISGETTASLRRHVYRRSSAEGDDATIVRVTRRVDDGEPGATTTGIPALSGSGRFVAFWSNATDMASVTGVFTVPQQQVYVCDMQAPIVSLQRCWVASTVQATAAGPFATFVGAGSAASRIGLAYPNDFDAGYVVWQGAPSGGFGGSMSGQGQTVFVSPVGDPRYQQPVVTP